MVAGVGDVDGDVNGDGFHDLLVSVPGHRSPAGTVGRVLVCYGSSGGVAGSQLWRVTKPWRVRLVEGVMDAPARYRWLLALASLSGVGRGAYGIGRLFERHRQAVIAGERADMQQQERMRIAQDLQDDLAPRLNQLGWRVSREKELGQDAGNLEQMESATRELSRSLRQIIWSLGPEQDTLENLVVNLGQYADQFLEGTNLPCRRDLPIELPDLTLSPNMRRQIFLAVNEALNNAVKHGRASEIWLRVRWDKPTLSMRIEDNGVGVPNQPGAQKATAWQICAAAGRKSAAKRVWRVWPVAEPGSCSESGRPSLRNHRAGLIAPDLPARSCQLREQQACSDRRMSEPPST